MRLDLIRNCISGSSDSLISGGREGDESRIKCVETVDRAQMTDKEIGDCTSQWLNHVLNSLVKKEQHFRSHSFVLRYLFLIFK